MYGLYLIENTMTKDVKVDFVASVRMQKSMAVHR